MKNLWTIASYPTAALAGYFIALGSREGIEQVTGLPELESTILILVVSGLVVGFLVDEIIPTYIHDVREGRAGAGGDGGEDFGGGGDFDGGDFDFE